jgi:hypothetical protein
MNRRVAQVLPAALLAAGASVTVTLAASTLINDGSFELGSPPASAWTETVSENCERIGDFSASWYVSSWDGSVDYWACGYCPDDTTGQDVPVTSSASQSILVPADSTSLEFYYVTYRPDADDEPADGDHVYVSINGVEVWALPLIQSNDTYPNWEGPVRLDLRTYAGQTVTLTVGGVSVGSVTGNARFDAFAFGGGPTPVMEETWGGIKVRFR